MELIGIYSVDDNSDVHLIEVQFNDTPNNIDVGQITQEIKGQSPENWQSPWDEKYLNEQGDEIIGDYTDIPQDRLKTRLLFFFHYLDFTKPLLTQHGKLDLTNPTSLPERLRGKVKYEQPD